MHGHSPGVVLRSLVIGLTAFLTVVDLFATQAILPSLTRHYNVTPAAMGFAVNASTMGMAVAGLVVGFLSPHIDRRLGILVSLVLLAVPTALLASAPDLTVFTILRVAAGPVHGVGLCADAGLSRRAMQLDGRRRRVCGLYHRQRRQQSDRAAGVGRGRRHARAGVELLFLRAAQSGRRGAGVLHHSARQADAGDARDAIAVRGDASPIGAIRRCARPSRSASASCSPSSAPSPSSISCWCAPPLSLGRMDLGFVYFVFAPSVVTTLFAGKAVARFGTRPAIWGALAVAAIGLPLMLSSHLAARPGRHGAGRRRHLLRAGLRDRLCRPGRAATTAASPAAPISPVTSSAAWSAAPCSDSCSTALAGRPASPASARRWRLRR